MEIKSRIATYVHRLRQSITEDRHCSMHYPRVLQYIGGKLICLDLIPTGSTVISGGVGSDLDFELELIRKRDVLVVGLDPTDSAEKFVESRKRIEPDLRRRYVYLKKALSKTGEKLKLYYGQNDFMSSVSHQHRAISAGNYFYCDAVTVGALLTTYTNTSYIKLDIEGAEYSILSDLEYVTVPQLSIEFHHHCSKEYNINETIFLINKLSLMGYDVIDYGAFHGAKRKLPPYAAKWSDLNCELLFIKP